MQDIVTQHGKLKHPNGKCETATLVTIITDDKITYKITTDTPTPPRLKGGRKGSIMKKYTVDYKSGDSRMNPGTSVDYMLVVVNDVELYAEAVAQDDENANYDALKASIIEQAREHGIDADILKFWYD